ncbi:MAG TPA: CU044_2847 family protein [Actinomycetota bacterium]|nr:CU044_2847 family protein [Actinomycetota bacterium]
MKRLVEFPLEDGGTVLVEVDEQAGGPVMRGRGGDGSTRAERTDRTFEEATASVTPAARSLINRLRAMENPPDEIEVEFGVQLSAKTGAFIASVAAEANFRVMMTWKGFTTRKAGEE